MSDDINWLVTVLYGDTLLRCALQVKRDAALPEDCAEYRMEPENRKAIHALLPLHVQTCGPIVAVDELFDVHIANDERDAMRAVVEAAERLYDNVMRTKIMPMTDDELIICDVVRTYRKARRR